MAIAGSGVHPAAAQSWEWAISAGAPGVAAGIETTADPMGRPYLGGVFRGAFAPAGVELPQLGGEDVYLAAFDATGRPRWAVAGGSALDDELTAVVSDGQGGLLAAGAYWVRGVFGDQAIEAAPNIKGLFLAKYKEDGRFEWVKGVNGASLKEVRALGVDSQGNIYMTGFFSERLLVDQAELRARGRTDLFLLKFTTEGHLLWAVHAGGAGDTRATTLALTPEGDVVVGGFFNDTLQIGAEVLTANTTDRDVFIARYSTEGAVQWARKAGGVHDDEITRVAASPQGDIWAVGYLVGVMRLDDTLSIQSRNGNSDFYLLRYRGDGRPLAARAMGGALIQQAWGLALSGLEVVVSGIYQGDMTIDGQTVAAGSGFGSFVAAFDGQLRLRWLKNLPTEEALYLTSLVASLPGELYSAGSFAGRAAFDGATLVSPGEFSPVLAKLTSSVTSSRVPPQILPTWSCFPNPARDQVAIQTTASQYEIQLLDRSGHRLGAWRSPRFIPLGHLPSGIYFLLYRDATGVDRRRIAVIR